MKTKVLGVVIFFMGIVILFPDVKCGIQKSRNEAQSTNSAKDTVSTKTTNVAQDTTVRVMTLFPSGQATIQPPKPIGDILLDILYSFSKPFDKYLSGELFLTDSLGRRTGYDPVNKIEYREIPKSNYGFEQENCMVLLVRNPLSGDYTLQVIAFKDEEYELWFQIVQGGNKDLHIFKQFIRFVDKDTVHTYMFHIGNPPGYELKFEKVPDQR